MKLFCHFRYKIYFSYVKSRDKTDLLSFLDWSVYTHITRENNNMKRFYFINNFTDNSCFLAMFYVPVTQLWLDEIDRCTAVWDSEIKVIFMFPLSINLAECVRIVGLHSYNKTRCTLVYCVKGWANSGIKNLFFGSTRITLYKTFRIIWKNKCVNKFNSVVIARKRPFTDEWEFCALKVTRGNPLLASHASPSLTRSAASAASPHDPGSI